MLTPIQHKIDFAVLFKVRGANPNGDPLNGNRPRTTYDRLGEVSDVCLKRKMRDRLQERGENIFVQADDRRVDEHRSLRARAEAKLGKDIAHESVLPACEAWYDVRAFGQILAFTGTKKGSRKKGAEATLEADGVSIPIRGPVSVHAAFSVAPVDVASIQITKSVNLEGDGTKRGPDTMGMKHRVEGAAHYLFFGAINPQLAERTRFSDADADKLKEILPRLFENDASSARPEGSMQVVNVFWWKHASKAGQYSSARVHGSLRVRPDGTWELEQLDGLQPEVISGF